MPDPATERTQNLHEVGTSSANLNGAVHPEVPPLPVTEPAAPPAADSGQCGAVPPPAPPSAPTAPTGSQVAEPIPSLPSMLQAMKGARRWLLASPEKVPHYINGTKRGQTDTPTDRALLATYGQASEVLKTCREGWLLGFALGPDGSGRFWQGIDFDDIAENRLADPANAVPGYVEYSPSGKGAHAIGFGRHFASLGSNGSGVEAYAAGRYFTFTENTVRDSAITCLADFVEKKLATRHGAAQATAASTGEAPLEQIDDKTRAELRAALLSMPADDYDCWCRMGLALKRLGEIGRALWMEWSSTSEKFNAAKAARKWDRALDGSRSGYQAVFAEAQRRGWLNPMSNAAQLPATETATGTGAETATQPLVELEFAMSTNTATIAINYLVDPYLPRRCVVGFYGRGGSAKSSFVAGMAAHISKHERVLASTLWISVEEPADWIKVRHIKSGGADQTLAVVMAVAKTHDAQGRAVESNFDVYKHLEPAIAAAKAGFEEAKKPPLGLVVLDTAVALTGWKKGESPNDDAAVKKLLAYLQAQAEEHDICIAIIGHANKGSHEHFADTVMGATAWTNSPRLSFVHAVNVNEEHAFVMRVAKSNFDTFGVPYTTEPVHTLYERENGPDSVLCRVQPGPIVWGSLPSLEMFKEATKPPKEEGSGGGGNQGVAGLVAGAVADLVKRLDTPVTREMVEAELDRDVHRKHWAKADEMLEMLPGIYGVKLVRGEKNRVFYQKA